MNASEHEYTTHDEVMFYDTDMGGVVHNIAYLRIIERCRTQLASRIGFDLAKMAETKIFPVVVRTEIDYRKPGVLGDVLVTHGTISEWSKARFWCAFEMRREGDQELLVTCRQQLAVVAMPEGKVLRLSDPNIGLSL